MRSKWWKWRTVLPALILSRILFPHVSKPTKPATADAVHYATPTGLRAQGIPFLTNGMAHAAAGSTVTLDNANSSGAASGTSLSFSLTIGSGSNRAISIGCSWSAKVTSPAVTIGGTNAPAVSGTNSTGGSGTAYMTAMFALAAPASGSQTIAVSWTGAAVSVCGAVSVTGADQTTPVNNGTFAFSTSGVPTVSITSNSGDLSIATLSLESGSAATGSTQTEKWNIRQSFAIGGAGSIGTGGAGPIVHAWDTTGSEWELSGANFKHQ